MLAALTMLYKDEYGQGLTEYVLIIVLVAMFVVAGLGLLGEELSILYDGIAAIF